MSVSESQRRRSARWYARHKKKHAREVREWRRKNRKKYLEIRRRHVYGPKGPAHFTKRKKKQKNRCQICKRWMSRPCQDHNHKTGKLRSLLCDRCNLVVGVVESVWGRRALAYLRKWRG